MVGRGMEKGPFWDRPRVVGRDRDRGPLHVALKDIQGGLSWRALEASSGQWVVVVGCKVKGSLGSRGRGVGGSQQRVGNQDTCGGHTLGGRLCCSSHPSTPPPPSSPVSPPAGWRWRRFWG